MELVDSANLMGRAEKLGDGARLGALYPATGVGGSLVAVDLLEVEPGGATPRLQTAEEHILYVLAGSGEVHAGDNGPAALVHSGSVLRKSPHASLTRSQSRVVSNCASWSSRPCWPCPTARLASIPCPPR